MTKLKNLTKKEVAALAAETSMKDALDRAFQPAQKPSEILALATASIPSTDAWLKNIAFERGRPLTLRGTAKTVDAVAGIVKRLDTNPEKRFRAVEPTNASSALVNKVPVTEFVVTAFPVGNLPILERSTSR